MAKDDKLPKCANTPIHIGHMVEKIVKKQKMSINEFAEKICSSRANVYDIFKRQELDTKKLQLISQALNVDLTAFYQRKNTSKKKYIVMFEIDVSELKRMLEKNNLTVLNLLEINPVQFH